jgi:metallo-beta-lactamase class B
MKSKNLSLLTVILFCLCSSPLMVKSQSVGEKITISHLVDNFYIYTTYNSYQGTLVPSNGMYALTDSGVIMCDTPWDTTQVMPLLDSIWVKHHQKVVLCVSTHFHDDRTGGLEILRREGVKTFTSQKTDELCAKNGEKRAEFVFVSDTTFKVGQCSFEAFYPGEGHSPDNIVIWFPNEKILYGGCLVKSVEASSLGNLSHANVGAWASTIEKVLARYKSPNFIIPGHQSWKSKQALQHTLKLIRRNTSNLKE